MITGGGGDGGDGVGGGLVLGQVVDVLTGGT